MPKIPMLSTGSVKTLPYYRHFYSLAVDEYNFYKKEMSSISVGYNDQHLIKEFAKIYSLNAKKPEFLIYKYIKNYHRTEGIKNGRRSRIKQLVLEELENPTNKKEFNNISDDTLKNWEDRWEDFRKKKQEARTTK